MCQSRAQGGRRCAYHMGSSRAVRALSAHAFGMTSEQATAVFTDLRRQGAERASTGRAAAPTREEYEQFLNRQTVNIEQSSMSGRTQTATRRAIMAARQENLPDAATFYAMSKMVARSRVQAANLRRTVTDLGRRAGLNRNEARAYFEAQMENPTSREISDNVEVEEGSYPSNPATVNALAALRRLGNSENNGNNPRIETTRRITRQPLASGVNSTLVSAGYDPEDGRLEVALRTGQDPDEGGSEELVYAYRNVSAEQWQGLNDSRRPMRTLGSIRSNPDHLYATPEEATDDAHRRRCDQCGQFRAMSHTCATGSASTTDTASANTQGAGVPEWRAALSRQWAAPVEERDTADYTTRPHEVTNETVNTSRYVSADVARLYLRSSSSPAASRAAVTRGDIAHTNISYSDADRSEGELGSVTGEVEVWRNEEGWQGRVRNVQCTCDVYARNRRCTHTERLENNTGTITRSIVDPAGLNEENRVRHARTEATRCIRVNRTRGRTIFASEFVNEGDALPDASGVSHHYRDRVDVARATDLRAALNFGDAQTEIHWSRPDPYAYRRGANDWAVSGNVRLHREDNGNVSVTERQLRCTCPQYRRNHHCPHVDYVGNQASRFATRGDNRVVPNIGDVNTALVAEREAARAAQEAERAALAAEAASMQARIDQFEAVAPEDRYENNYEAFDADMNEADGTIPFMTEDATAGICSPDGGRAFGVELEFDLPDSMSYYEKTEALEAIGRDMNAAGLSSSSRQQGYHSAARSGYQNWSFEHDATVAGEIVSPIMHDTPENWRQLSQVCEIIKRHGGVASVNAGSHVHVSTGSYGTNVDKHVELSRMVTRYEDSVYRLSTDPARGTHRPTTWCAPHNVDDYAIANARQHRGSLARYFGTSHSYGMNYASTGTGAANRDNVEFRQWDATLDPGTIQAQVKLSAAMVDAAERRVVQNGGPMEVERTHAYGASARRGRGDDEQSTQRTREMIDTLFHRREDKKQITALFAATTWQGGGGQPQQSRVAQNRAAAAAATARTAPARTTPARRGSGAAGQRPRTTRRTSTSTPSSSSDNSMSTSSPEFRRAAERAASLSAAQRAEDLLRANRSVDEDAYGPLGGAATRRSVRRSRRTNSSIDLDMELAEGSRRDEF